MNKELNMPKKFDLTEATNRCIIMSMHYTPIEEIKEFLIKEYGLSNEDACLVYKASKLLIEDVETSKKH